MPEAFDPYLKWLGIPAKDRPIHYYRLLGIEPFESDADVISNAADQRMAHVRTFAAGQHAQAAQKILNELAQARVVLLNPEKREKYNAILRQKLAQQASASGSRKQFVWAQPLEEEGAVEALVIDTRPAPAATATARQAAKSEQSESSLPPWLIWAVGGVAAGIVGISLVLLGMFLTRGREVAQADPAAGGSASTTSNTPAASPPSEKTPKKPPKKPAKKPDTTLATREPPSEKPADTPATNLPADKPSDTPGLNADGLPTNVQPQPSRSVFSGLKGMFGGKQGPPSAPAPAKEPPPDVPQEPKKSEPAVEPAKPEPPKKVAEPAAKAKEAANKQIQEIFGGDMAEARTSAQKMALAERLAREAAQTRDDPAARFALYQAAAGLAADGENMNRAMALIDTLGSQFDVSTPALKADVLTKLARASAARPGDVAGSQLVVTTAQQLIQEAIDVGDAKTATRLVKVTLPAARKLKDKKLIATLMASQKDLERLEIRYEAAHKAAAALADDPDDAKNNLAAGAWYCLVANQWEKGLPWLAKGDDGQLAAAAKLDLANPDDPAKQVEVGDRWWDLSDSHNGVEHARLRARATSWYQKALPRLTGLVKTKVEKRLDDSGVVTGSYALKFDGQKSHVVLENFGYNGLSPITLEAIVQPASREHGHRLFGGPAWDSGEQTIIGNLNNSTGLKLGLAWGNVNFEFFYSVRHSLSSSYIGTQSRRVNSNNNVTPDAWTHLAAIYDGASIRLYVGGHLQRSENLDGVQRQHKPSAMPFIIGGSPQGGGGQGNVAVGNCFRGLIKAVRISNTPVYTDDFEPPAQLAAERGTVLLMLFNKGKGDTVPATVGKKVIGQIKGAEWVEAQ